MVDLLSCIAAGFGGKLKQSPEARKLAVWKKPFGLAGGINFAVAGILVEVIDVRMNLDEAEDVAMKSAGEVAAIDEVGIMTKYQKEIERLERRKKQY